MHIYDPTLLGLQVAKVMGEELLVFCPYHYDGNPSAEYNVEKGLFYCFGCHERKNAKQLAADLGGSLVPMRVIPDAYRKRPGEDLDWVSLLKTKRAIGNKYLKERRVMKWQIARYDIRENEDGILFPLYDRFDKIRGMQIRHYTRQPKYMFHGERAALWPMGTLMRCDHRIQRTLYLTEGIFGTLRLGMTDRVQSAAIMGSSSIARVVKVVESLNNRNPYAIMDKDWAGLVAAGKFILHGIEAVLTPDDWPDSPDEFKKEHVNMLDANPSPYATSDVMDIVERSDNPAEMQRVLEKYWRKI